jgi:excisionase family DNA binding protein
MSITRVYLRQLIRDGKFPAEAVHYPVPGGHARIDVEALDRWMESRCSTPTPGQPVAS